jgi:hypothetical protein
MTGAALSEASSKIMQPDATVVTIATIEISTVIFFLQSLLNTCLLLDGPSNAFTVP